MNPLDKNITHTKVYTGTSIEQYEDGNFKILGIDLADTDLSDGYCYYGEIHIPHSDNIDISSEDLKSFKQLNHEV